MSLILNTTPILNSFEIEFNILYIGKASDPDYSRPLKINNSNPVLNPCCLVMYVKFFKPFFEVVKKGRMLMKIKQLNPCFEHYLKYIF
jgi:hypothetical protein